jgi:hypothetical protein
MQEMLKAFDDLGRRVRIGPMFFYSYNSGLQDADGHPSGSPPLEGALQIVESVGEIFSSQPNFACSRPPDIAGRLAVQERKRAEMRV